MALPAMLKNFDTFVDGDNFIGQIPEVSLGKIAEKVESYRGGGTIANRKHTLQPMLRTAAPRALRPPWICRCHSADRTFTPIGR